MKRFLSVLTIIACFAAGFILYTAFRIATVPEAQTALSLTAIAVAAIPYYLAKAYEMLTEASNNDLLKALTTATAQEPVPDDLDQKPESPAE